MLYGIQFTDDMQGVACMLFIFRECVFEFAPCMRPAAEQQYTLDNLPLR